MRVRYRPAALAQLDAIFRHVAAHDRAAATRVIRAIRRQIELLARFPYGARPSEIPGIRECPVTRYPYIIFYAVDEQAREIHILRVRHTAQDPAHHLD